MALPTPVAKYLFDDVSNIGKDSVGSYDMEIVKNNNQYTAISGGIEFNGGFVLAQKKDNNIFRNLTEFTICFEYKMLADNLAWASNFGVSDVGGGNFLFLDSSGGDTRFHASNATNAAGNATLATIWGGAAFTCNDYKKFTITVKPGGQINVYVDGVLSTSESKIPANIPANWTLYNEAENACRFAIGAPVNNKGDIGNTGKAGVKEVVFYDKEFSAAEVTQYWAEYDAAHPVFSSCEVDLSETIRVSTGATDAHVLKFAPNGIYEATLSNNSKTNVTVTWNNVVDREGVRYLEGVISGVNNPAKLKAYGKITTTAAKVVSAEVDSGVIVIDTTPDAKILEYGHNGDYEVTLEDNTKMTATIAWTGVKEEGGKKYIEGTLSNVNNPDGVKAKGLITVGGETELKPFAHYEFKNSRTPGEDSTGNYKMTAVGTPKANKDQEGVFDGKSGLVVENGFTSKLNSFSLYFEISKTAADNGDWVTPVTLGSSNNQWLVFNFAPNSNLLRLAFSSEGSSNVIAGGSNQFWGKEMGNVSDAEFSTVMITVEAGGLCHVYFNDQEISEGGGKPGSPYKVPDGFKFNSDEMKLSLGFDMANRFFNGKLKNVRLYDCALTPGQVVAFNAYGKVFPHDNSPYIKSVTDTAKFAENKITSETLFDSMNAETMLEKLNVATVTATFTDNTTKEIKVRWLSISQTGTTYFAKGRAEAVGIGATAVATKEITQELTVYKTLNVTVADAENGTVSANVQTAKYGDTVTITVTPNEGYLIESVMVNGEAIEGNEGVYTYTVGAEDTKISVSAMFAEQPKENKKKGCNAAADGVLAILVSATLIAAGAVVFAKKSKKNN